MHSSAEVLPSSGGHVGSTVRAGCLPAPAVSRELETRSEPILEKTIVRVQLLVSRFQSPVHRAGVTCHPYSGGRNPECGFLPNAVEENNPAAGVWYLESGIWRLASGVVSGRSSTQCPVSSYRYPVSGNWRLDRGRPLTSAVERIREEAGIVKRGDAGYSGRRAFVEWPGS